MDTITDFLETTTGWTIFAVTTTAAVTYAAYKLAYKLNKEYVISNNKKEDTKEEEKKEENN